MFHISDIKKYVACPVSFWLNAHGVRSSFIAFNHMEEGLSFQIAEKLNATDVFYGYQGQSVEESLQALNEHEWFSKIRFEYHNLRIKVPFLHKVENGFDLYFIQMSANNTSDLTYYANHLWVLENNGIHIQNIYTVRINPSYLYEDQLDLGQLFTISDHVKRDISNKLIDAVKEQMTDLTSLLEEMQICYDSPVPESVRSKNCMKKSKCNYYDTCFESELLVEDDSILTLSASQYKAEMKKEGIEKLADADISRVEGTPFQYGQIMASKKEGLFVDKIALSSWFKDNWVGPYCFIDFEWESYILPPFVHLKPYSKVCFQYSLHIENEDGSLVHKEFLGVNDCREEFITHLIDDLPEKGSIIAYNAEGAEKLRLLELGEQFPQYKEKLVDFCDRMIDLSIPFQNGMVYDIRMRGYSSIKVLLPICDSSLSYAGLEVHDGMMAVDSWRALCNDPENQEIRKNLLTYCGLDSYSMIVVTNWLRNLLK